jgi:predicted transcriptional regulator
MPTSVLLSIKPEFVEKIFDGLKRYEFRRVIFKSQTVSKVVIYASNPVQRVVGEFQVGGILALQREQLWRRTREYSGIAKAYFDEYFGGKGIAYAIEIKSARRYRESLRLSHVCPSAKPPQSFMYLHEQ